MAQTILLAAIGLACAIYGLLWAFALGISDNPADNESPKAWVALALMVLGSAGLIWAIIRTIQATTNWLFG